MSENFDKIIQSTKRLVARARVRLFWETYAPTLAPGFLAIGIFIFGAWLGFWQWIGDPVRLMALSITLFFLARSVLRALSLRRPTYSDARRRVELDSGQAHRPLDVLDDRPALSADIWPAHQKKALNQARLLHRATPQAALAPIDPYYLRFILPLVLLATAVFMAGFSFERLRTAVSPSWQSPIRANQISYEAWIDPPAYTGRPPIYFKDGANVAVPAGSEFVARISGVKTPPRPRLSSGWRSKFLTPKRLGAKSFEIREVINDTSNIEFRVGLTRKSFDLNVSDDLPPEVEIVEPPEADKRDRLTLVYGLKDDFGVETLQLEMSLLKDGIDPETAFEDATILANIPLPSSSQTSVDSAKAALDLSKTRYAGRKVIGRLIATDGAQQTGLSKPAWFTVPDKIFVEPLAKAVSEQRTLVMAGLDETYKPEPKPKWEPSDGFWNEYEPRLHWDRAPAPIQRATLLIEAVTDEPAGLFKDPAVYMGLRHARSQMRHAESLVELQGLPEDLWRIALRAEFGILGSALEEMREAEAALREGIARRASKREVDTLFERYNLAVDAYTEELRRKAQEEGNVSEGGSGGGGQQSGSLDEIQELLKAIEEANAAGDTEGARKALARLAEVLENMQIQLSQGGGGGSGGEPSGGDMSEEEKQQLEDLADLTGKQRDLQDETEQAERNDQSEEELDPQELARRQAELRDLLDNLGDTLPTEGEGEQSESGENGEGEPGNGQDGAQSGEDGTDPGAGTEPGAEPGQGTEPGEAGSGGSGNLQEQFSEGIGAAEEAMRRSEEALQQGNHAGAGEAQQDAIRALREAGEALAEAVSEGQAEENGNDPLGRSDDGFDSGNDTADIDDRDNATRSRELLEELRRRAAEQQREAEEREYLERLLDRF
ncbi:MAG: DUF4175 family protein [Litorimonas sp.]